MENKALEQRFRSARDLSQTVFVLIHVHFIVVEVLSHNVTKVILPLAFPVNFDLFLKLLLWCLYVQSKCSTIEGSELWWIIL